MGTFVMSFLWSYFGVNPLLSGLIIGLWFGITDHVRERQ
tara:strand:- start:672 stop:788 length:117 start_codon:yes stop_codon:yes gene_type:complete